MRITVERIKRVQGCGNLRGYASVRLDDLLIHGFRVVQEEGKRAWVSVPQLSWQDDDGSPAYWNLVELPADAKAAVKEAVLRAWEASHGQ